MYILLTEPAGNLGLGLPSELQRVTEAGEDDDSPNPHTSHPQASHGDSLARVTVTIARVKAPNAAPSVHTAWWLEDGAAPWNHHRNLCMSLASRVSRCLFIHIISKEKSPEPKTWGREALALLRKKEHPWHRTRLRGTGAGRGQQGEGAGLRGETQSRGTLPGLGRSCLSGTLELALTPEEAP